MTFSIHKKLINRDKEENECLHVYGVNGYSVLYHTYGVINYNNNNNSKAYNENNYFSLYTLESKKKKKKGRRVNNNQ